MDYIDVHCHLEMCKDIEGIIERAKKAGVKMITQGVNHKSNMKSLEFSSKYKEVKPALGLYPIDALSMKDEEVDLEIEFIRKNKDKIVAIGEVGMDFKESQEKDRQERIFRKLVRLSIELNKPIIVHSRKAEAEVIKILEEEKAAKVIMHCFSGNFKLVKKIEENKWHFSIPTSIKNSEHFKKMAKEVSLSQILCETDSPCLHPDKLEDNEPANVIESYKKIAEAKGISLEEAKEAIDKNYERLFAK
jgi:TatD DNase family protein